MIIDRRRDRAILALAREQHRDDHAGCTCRHAPRSADRPLRTDTVLAGDAPAPAWWTRDALRNVLVSDEA